MKGMVWSRGSGVFSQYEGGGDASSVKNEYAGACVCRVASSFVLSASSAVSLIGDPQELYDLGS